MATSTTPNDTIKVATAHGGRPIERAQTTPAPTSIITATALEARSAVVAFSITTNGTATGRAHHKR